MTLLSLTKAYLYSHIRIIVFPASQPYVYHATHSSLTHETLRPMTSQEQDLSALRRQLRCAEHDLQSELFLINHPCGDDEADPFAALKCERLYRTVRALKLKIERLQHIHSHPHRETSPQSYGASTTLPTRFAERESRTMPRRTRDVDDAEWSLVNCARAEGPLRGLRLDPSVDVGEGSEGAGESDHFLESWTWNGRPLRLVNIFLGEICGGRCMMKICDNGIGEGSKAGWGDERDSL